MAKVLDEVSTVTAKGQTTIPKSVRRALGVEGGDRIAFRVEEDAVSLRRVDQSEGDPALDGFLDLLARDIAGRPDAIAPLAPSLEARATNLAKGVDDDPEAPIAGDVAL